MLEREAPLEPLQCEVTDTFKGLGSRAAATLVPFVCSHPFPGCFPADLPSSRHHTAVRYRSMPLHNHFFAYDDPSVDDDSDSTENFLAHPSDAAEKHAKETDSLLPRPHSTSAVTHDNETRTLLYACGLTTFFFFVELIGGYLAGSLGIMSDAAHLLSDLAGFVISLIAVSVSRLPPNAHMTYGFARAEVLGAFVSILFIWALTLTLVFFAIERLFNPEPVHGSLMLMLGIVGLMVNFTLGFVLGHGHCSGHGHSHGEHSHNPSNPHAHDDTVPNQVSLSEGGNCVRRLDDVENHNPDQGNESGHGHEHDIERGDTFNRPNDIHNHRKDTGGQTCSSANTAHRGPGVGKDQRSVNIQAAYLHVIGDILQNVGVIVAALVLMFKPSWTFVDPICTLMFAVMVLMTTKDLARETMTVLMEGTPRSLKLDDIHAKLLELEGVNKVDALHVWSITSRRPALSVHLYKQSMSDGHDVVKDAQKVLAEHFGITHATIQVNFESVEYRDEVMEDPLKNDSVSYRPLN